MNLSKSTLRKALQVAHLKGVRKGRREAEEKFDAILIRFHQLKSLNGSGDAFAKSWFGDRLKKLFGRGKKEAQPDAETADDTTELIAAGDDTAEVFAGGEKTPDQVAAEVFQLAPDPSHVKEFRFLEDPNPAIEVTFKAKGKWPESQYRYDFPESQRDTARVVWEEMSQANHPGIVIWHWLIRGGVPYKRLKAFLKAFDPNEARDESGKWTSGGGDEKLVSPSFRKTKLDAAVRRKLVAAIAYSKSQDEPSPTTVKIADLYAGQDEVDATKVNSMADNLDAIQEVRPRPIVVKTNSGKLIIAGGHHRLEALKDHGDTQAKVWLVHESELSDDFIRKAWSESDHPRDHGKFSSVPGAGSDTALSLSTDHPAAARVRTLSERIGSVPAALREKVTSYVKDKYGKLVTKYGKAGARAILAASVLMLPVPVPFASFIPIALAEAVSKIGGLFSKAVDGGEKPDDATIQAEARKFLEGLHDDHAEEMPGTDGEPHPHSDAAVLAMLEHAIPEMELGGNPKKALHAIADALEVEHVEKAAQWDETKHPRDDAGRFVSKDAIHAARSDPAKAAELRARVTDPGERRKLDDALEGKTDIGQTKRAEQKQQAAQKRYLSQKDREKANALISKLSDFHAKPGAVKLTKADLRRLAEHIPHMNLEELKRARLAMRANLHGDRRKLDIAARLQSHAKRMIEERTGAPKKRSNKLDTVIATVMWHGGIDPDSVKDHIGDISALEDNIPLSVFRRGGPKLDELAQELHSAGHIKVPEGAHPGEYLLDQIRERAHTLGADLDKQHEEKLNAYYQALHEAQQHHDAQAIEEAVRSGEGAGRGEAQEDLLGPDRGESQEPEGEVDTSFDFGANEPPAPPEEPPESAQSAPETHTPASIAARLAADPHALANATGPEHLAAHDLISAALRGELSPEQNTAITAALDAHNATLGTKNPEGLKDKYRRVGEALAGLKAPSTTDHESARIADFRQRLDDAMENAPGSALEEHGPEPALADAKRAKEDADLGAVPEPQVMPSVASGTTAPAKPVKSPFHGVMPGAMPDKESTADRIARHEAAGTLDKHVRGLQLDLDDALRQPHKGYYKTRAAEIKAELAKIEEHRKGTVSGASATSPAMAGTPSAGSGASWMPGASAGRGTPDANPTEHPTTPHAAAVEDAEAKGASPRETAAAAQKALDEDYEFARASSVRNAGEDLKGSARHKVNAWRGLADAEKNGTAEHLVTRDNLLKAEPHALMSTITPENALPHLAAHLAMNAFPATPGDAKQMARYLSGRERDPARKSAEELRAQYYEAYKTIKTEAEKAALEESDPKKVAERVRDATKKLIDKFRGIPESATGYERQSGYSAKDSYNPVANALVALHRSTAGGYRPGPNSVHGRLEDFSKRLATAYPEETAELDSHTAEHVKDVLEGHSFNKTFGTTKAGGMKQFSAADLYVKHASRRGGRVIDATTVKSGTDFIMNNAGMRGLQWGNSVTDDERQHHLTKTAEALADLADATGLPDDAMGLKGTLGLAVGARGHGTALAHYEPSNKVINLTRKNGTGSLAHEWGHALDHLLGGHGKDDYLSERVAGGSQNAQVADAMKAVRDAMRESKFNERLGDVVRKMVRNKEMSEGKAKYWTSGREKFARAFERHIQHKLESDGRENTYLAGGMDHELWPNKEETAHLAPAFDALFQAVREHHFGGKAATVTKAGLIPAEPIYADLEPAPPVAPAVAALPPVINVTVNMPPVTPGGKLRRATKDPETGSWIIEELEPAAETDDDDDEEE